LRLLLLDVRGLRYRLEGIAISYRSVRRRRLHLLGIPKLITEHHALRHRFNLFSS